MAGSKIKGREGKRVKNRGSWLESREKERKRKEVGK